jgi:hypothetical protein
LIDQARIDFARTPEERAHAEGYIAGKGMLAKRSWSFLSSSSWYSWFSPGLSVEQQFFFNISAYALEI